MTKSVFSRPYRVLIEELISARKAAGMTQQQVADALGKPQSCVAKYENGERRLDLVEFEERRLKYSVAMVHSAEAREDDCHLERVQSRWPSTTRAPGATRRSRCLE